MKQSRMLAWVVVAALLAGYALPIRAQGTEPWEPGPDLDQTGLTVARDRAGQLWAAWEASDGDDAELLFSRQIAGGWSAPQPLSPRPDAWDRSPLLAVSNDGTVWVAWSSASHDAPDRAALYTSYWVGSRWSEPVRVPTGDLARATEPYLTTGRDNTLWLAWVRFDGVDDEIWASQWDGEAWSMPRQVSADDGDRSLYDRQPRIAAAGDGEAWLVWTAHQDGVDDEIMFSHWNGTRWSREQVIGDDDELLDVWPSLAVDSEGRPWVAWHGSVVDGEPGAHHIFVSHWEPERGAWTAEEIVSTPVAAAVDQVRPSLAPAGAGGMHVAWVAHARASTLLAHAVHSAGRWSELVAVEEGVSSGSVYVVGGTSGSPHFVWLNAGGEAVDPVQMATLQDAQPLDEWLVPEEPSVAPLVPPISNRFLAFGDSITWGGYPTDDPFQDPFYSYPSTLEDTFDSRVMPVEVINVGVPGERLRNGKDRIDDEVRAYTPQYVMLMEGTNDVSHNALPSEVREYMLLAIDTARHAGVDNLKLMVATLPPRIDDKYDETEEMNLEAIIPAANEKNMPVCDVWTSFLNYVDSQGLLLRDIYYDEKHPDQEGLNLLAWTWYGCLRNKYTWLIEETVPPTTWIESLPPGVMCNQPITVTWAGSDNLSWVTDYDVQVSVNGGVWADWLVGVAQTTGTYPAQPHGTSLGFQVRGRDVVGNVSAWSDPAYTTVSGSGELTAWIEPLPAVQDVPFTVRWGGSGTCGPAVAYDVQYRIGDGAWVDWKYRTADTSALFDPPEPQYGQVHYFRAWAVDGLGNVSPASPEVATLVARYTLTGRVYNVRHEGVSNPQVTILPTPELTRPLPGGGFAAYLASGGILDISVSRAGLYGALPPMNDIVVSADVTGLTFVLPPADDAVAGGDLAAGDLSSWQLGGTSLPVLDSTAHTGSGAARLGGSGVSSTLSQVITPSLSMDNPTLSFMVRLRTAGAPSGLEVGLANSTTLTLPVTCTLPVVDATWTHAWYDLSGQISEPLTLTFRVAGTPAILLDEVRLGSAVQSGYLVYLPLVTRGQ